MACDDGSKTSSWSNSSLSWSVSDEVNDDDKEDRLDSCAASPHSTELAKYGLFSASLALMRVVCLNLSISYRHSISIHTRIYLVTTDTPNNSRTALTIAESIYFLGCTVYLVPAGQISSHFLLPSSGSGRNADWHRISQPYTLL